MGSYCKKIKTIREYCATINHRTMGSACSFSGTLCVTREDKWTLKCFVRYGRLELNVRVSTKPSFFLFTDFTRRKQAIREKPTNKCDSIASSHEDFFF